MIFSDRFHWIAAALLIVCRVELQLDACRGSAASRIHFTSSGRSPIVHAVWKPIRTPRSAVRLPISVNSLPRRL